MSRARLRLVGALAVVAVEAWLYLRYAALGTQFHFWLHALLGGALGLSLLTLVRLLRPPRPVPAWSDLGAGFVGHVWSAVPDVLFLVAGVLHVGWMDVFALHITAHFLWPGPLPAALVLWSLAVLAATALRLGARRVAAGTLLATAGAFAVALALHSPVPHTLEQVVRGGSNGGPVTAWTSWVCSVRT